VTLRLVYPIFCQLSAGMALLMRSEASKTAEILVLRHQVSVLRRHVARPRPTWADRALISALAQLLSKAGRRHLFVTPGTLLRWHANVITRRWTAKRQRCGRPPTSPPLRRVIVRMATENPGWGYSHGAAASDPVRVIGEGLCGVVALAIGPVDLVKLPARKPPDRPLHARLSPFSGVPEESGLLALVHGEDALRLDATVFCARFRRRGVVLCCGQSWVGTSVVSRCR
jgi:hypothetical protein